jgi:hypothetical protein
MPIPVRRPATRKMLSKRRVVNVQSLQMMVSSGVVRRADFIPQPVPRQARVLLSKEQQQGVHKEVVSEQGWLSRAIFGPKPQPVLTKRS